MNVMTKPINHSPLANRLKQFLFVPRISCYEKYMCVSLPSKRLHSIIHCFSVSFESETKKWMLFLTLSRESGKSQEYKKIFLQRKECSCDFFYDKFAFGLREKRTRERQREKERERERPNTPSKNVSMKRDHTLLN